MVQKTEARQRILFSGLNSRLTKKAKQSLRVCRRCTLFIKPTTDLDTYPSKLQYA